MKRQFLFGCLFIALAAVIFSTMEVLLKLPAVAGAFHPMQITLERFLVGGICLLPVAGWTLRRKGIRLTRRDVGTFALTGLFCVPLSMVLYQLAITHGQANVVAVLFSGNPIFVTLLAFLLLHETIAWNNLLALVLEVLGIGAIAGLGGSAVSLSSVALAVLAALFFAAYAVLGKRQTARTGSLVVTCGQLSLGRSGAGRPSAAGPDGGWKRAVWTAGTDHVPGCPVSPRADGADPALFPLHWHRQHRPGLRFSYAGH